MGYDFRRYDELINFTNPEIVLFKVFSSGRAVVVVVVSLVFVEIPILDERSKLLAKNLEKNVK